MIVGGDTIAALRKAEALETEVDFVSTGGGAYLFFLGGGNLPGMFYLIKSNACRKQSLNRLGNKQYPNQRVYF